MKKEPVANLRRALLWALLGAVVLLWGFRDRLEHEVSWRLMALRSAPSEGGFRRLLSESKDPGRVLLRFWETEKIPHRRMAVSYLNDQTLLEREWVQRLEPILELAALDPDTSVRELAMGALARQGNSRLFPLALAQLQDADPEVRLLGLQYLKRDNSRRAVATVVDLLDDPDLQVVATAAATLRKWTGIDFGVRVADAIPVGGSEGGAVSPEKRQAILDGVGRWKEWWLQHRAEFAARQPVAQPAPNRLPVEDFALEDLAGKKIRLSDFRGKRVLLNFWTTWCTSCLAEIPGLIELHRLREGQLVILGISLDGVDDEHGHDPGAGDDSGEWEEGSGAPADLDSIRSRVRRCVADRSIPYRVLLDPQNRVGERFFGGELPTNVLIDQEGYLRRRFIGARSWAVYDAMLRAIEEEGKSETNSNRKQ